MTERKSLSNAGRGLLMSVAVGTLPIAGCVQVAPSATRLPSGDISVSVSEKEFYDRAVATGDPAIVSQYIAKYPDSALIPSVLASMSPSQVQRISNAAACGIDTEVLAQIPQSIRRQLCLEDTEDPSQATAAAASSPAWILRDQVRDDSGREESDRGDGYGG